MALEVLRLEKKILFFTKLASFIINRGSTEVLLLASVIINNIMFSNIIMISFIIAGFASGFSAKTRGWPRAGAAQGDSTMEKTLATRLHILEVVLEDHLDQQQYNQHHPPPRYPTLL